MPYNLLYIEDDAIDILALKRILRNFDDIVLHTCGTLSEVEQLDLTVYDFILSDSNLPDGGLTQLKKILPPSKTQFISGSEVSGENIWVKPIDLSYLRSLLQTNNIVNLQYINDLADGDDEYVIEMIDTALGVLPKRWTELDTCRNDLVLLKKAAHKTKSSFRVCGIQNDWLTEIEGLDESSFKSEQKDILLNQVKKQIDQAVQELQKIKN